MALLKFLKENKNVRKIFGRRELKIIEKQLNGVNLTQSEKNRLSRDIRKKFEFIKEAERFSDEFDLKKGAGIKDIIEEAKEIILESSYSPNIKKIYIFGSVIENTLTFRSDIDVAVKFDRITKKEAGKFRIYCLGRVNERVDIQVLNILPEKIKKQIRKNHKVLYER